MAVLGPNSRRSVFEIPPGSISASAAIAPTGFVALTCGLPVLTDDQLQVQKWQDLAKH